MMPDGHRPFVAIAGALALCAAAMSACNAQPGSPARPGAAPRAPGQAQGSTEITLTDVKLERLQEARTALDEPGRNPFRFQARPAPAPARTTLPARAASPGPVQPVPPAGPPPLAPIPLRFIGFVEAPQQAGRVAIMSDGKGNVFYGKEGDTIEGRYRMLKVSADIVELAYVDGRGRQTIRLSGQ